MQLSFSDFNFNFSSLSDEKLKEEFNNNFKNSTKDKESLNKLVAVCIEAIKRLYEYEFKQNDFDILQYFLNSVSLNISNEDAFYAFLIYSVLSTIDNSVLHCHFSTKFTMVEQYNKAVVFYEFFELKTALNEVSDEYISFDANKTAAIHETNIIFSLWQNLIFNYICYRNIEQIANKFNFRFNKAFIFDLDRIIYDYEKCSYKINIAELPANTVEIKDYYKLYQNVVGVSRSLFFEKKKIEKNCNVKIEILEKNEEVLKCLENPKDVFYTNKNIKQRNIVKKIEQLYKDGKTVVVDSDSHEEARIIRDFLQLKKIPCEVIANDTPHEFAFACRALTPNAVTIFNNLLGAMYSPKLGGNWEDIARMNAFLSSQDKTTNYYREKLKKELKIQKEIAQENIEKIQNGSDVHIIFAQHYIELKNEYLFLNNYAKVVDLENVVFFNSPQDELYTKFRLEKLKVLNQEMTEENKHLFKIISKFLYRLRKIALKTILKQNQSKLVCSVQLYTEEEQSGANKCQMSISNMKM